MLIFPPSIGNWGEDKTNLKGPPGFIPVGEEGFRYIKVSDNPYLKMSVLTQRWSLSQCHDAECPRLFPEGKYQKPWHHSVTKLVGGGTICHDMPTLQRFFQRYKPQKQKPSKVISDLRLDSEVFVKILGLFLNGLNVLKRSGYHDLPI